MFSERSRSVDNSTSFSVADARVVRRVSCSNSAMPWRDAPSDLTQPILPLYRLQFKSRRRFAQHNRILPRRVCSVHPHGRIYAIP
jgi:hypothetical protein